MKYAPRYLPTNQPTYLGKESSRYSYDTALRQDKARSDIVR